VFGGGGGMLSLTEKVLKHRARVLSKPKSALERCINTLSAQPAFSNKYITYSKRLLMPSWPHALTATKALRVLLLGENAARREKPIKCHVKLFIRVAKVEILCNLTVAFSK
jgi:hypothetical protein